MKNGEGMCKLYALKWNTTVSAKGNISFIHPNEPFRQFTFNYNVYLCISANSNHKT